MVIIILLSKGEKMQTLILYTLAGTFIGLLTNQKHLVSLGFILSGLLIYLTM